MRFRGRATSQIIKNSLCLTRAAPSMSLYPFACLFHRLSVLHRQVFAGQRLQRRAELNKIFMPFLVSRTITIVRRLARHNNTARYYCPSSPFFSFFSSTFSLLPHGCRFSRLANSKPAIHRPRRAPAPRLRDVTGLGRVLQLLSVLVDYFSLRPREEWERPPPGVLLSARENRARRGPGEGREQRRRQRQRRRRRRRN